MINCEKQQFHNQITNSGHRRDGFPADVLTAGDYQDGAEEQNICLKDIDFNWRLIKMNR